MKVELKSRILRYSRVTGPVLRWWLRILGKATVVIRQAFWRNARGGFKGFRKWVNSPDGVVAVSVLGLILILCALWLIDTVRLYEPPQPMSAEAEPKTIEVAEPDPLLATLNGRLLRLSDVNEFAQQAGKLPVGEFLTVDEVIERGLVEEAVDQFLLARAAAVEAAVMSDPDVLTRLSVSRTRILSAAYLQDVIARAATEENAVALYQIQRENITFADELRLRHIVVNEESLAFDIIRSLEEGADFNQIARDISIDKAAAARDGALGFLSYSQMPPGYADTVYALKTGERSMPIKSGARWAIVRVEGRRPVKPPSFSAVRDEIMEFLKLQAIEDALENLRTEADVVFYEPDNSAEQETTEDLPEQE